MSREPLLTPMGIVKPESVTWLSEPRIPSGKATIIEGEPGLGKTHIAIEITARVSRGTLGELGETDVSSPRNVIYMTAEDGLADTIRPRLDAAGADCDRVWHLDGYREDGKDHDVTLSDLDVLARALEDHRPALVVIDPLQGFLGAGVDMYRPNEVRPVLSGLARLAERFSCAIILIRHYKKSPSSALNRGVGSIDFTAAVRSVLVVGEDPEDSERRILAHAKSNLAPKGASLAFTLLEGRLQWDGDSDLGADDLALAEGKRSKQGDAAEFLQTILKPGERPVTEIKREATAAGYAWRTIQRAKDQLRVTSDKERGAAGQWFWSLPRKDANGAGKEPWQPWQPSPSKEANISKEAKIPPTESGGLGLDDGVVL